jgi:hypothetical protein
MLAPVDAESRRPITAVNTRDVGQSQREVISALRNLEQ